MFLVLKPLKYLRTQKHFHVLLCQPAKAVTNKEHGQWTATILLPRFLLMYHHHHQAVS
jgi:hypothetical protein